MNDKDLQQLFGQLKKTEYQQAPGFEELLARPEPVLNRKIRYNQQLRNIKKFSIAASIAILMSIGLWQFIDIGSQASPDSLGMEWMNDPNSENILNWEAPSDQLLPVENTEIKKEPQSLEAVKNNLQPSNLAGLPQQTQEMIEENPELTNAMFQNGSISYWTSPTDFLLPNSTALDF